MKISEFVRRARKRLANHSLLEHVRGLWFARKMTHHRIVMVTGRNPAPRIIGV